MQDVVIAGAGPAGSLAALILARAGVRVRVFDRAAFPRDKLCGDTLNPGALAVLARHRDISPLVAASLPIDGMWLTGPGGIGVRGRYASGATGRAIVRRHLDQWLAAAAADAGASVEERSTVLGPIIDGPVVAGVRVRDARGTERACHARVTIAADGRRSRLAFACGLARQPVRPRRWAVGSYFHAVAGMGGAGEMHVRPGYYVGLAPMPGGLTNVCCVTSRSADADWRVPSTILRSTITADPDLAPRFARARPAAPVAVLGPLAVDVDTPGLPGLLLAGDAAGFIDPMTGDGLRFALAGAEMASALAFDVLAGRVPDDAVPRELARRRRMRFGTKWRFNRAVRTLVDWPAGVAVAAAVARVLPSAFTQMIRYAGDCSEY